MMNSVNARIKIILVKGWQHFIDASVKGSVPDKSL
jgi:hypothetical protein